MKLLLLSVLCLLGATDLALAGAAGPCGTATIHAVPEPATIALLAAGIGGIFAIRRRK